MTEQIPPPQQQPEALSPEEARAVLAIAALLAGEVVVSGVSLAGAVAAEILSVAPAALLETPQVAAQVSMGIAGLILSGVPRPAASGGSPLATPPGRTATHAQVGEELLMKGRYALAAIRRVAGAESKLDALRKEPRYHRQHLEASRERLLAAGRIDDARAEYGLIGSWWSVRDSGTDPQCWERHGKNMRLDRRPPGGWPGQRDGGNCRCEIRGPIDGAPMLN